MCPDYCERYKPSPSLRGSRLVGRRSNLGDADGLAKRRCNDNRETAKKRCRILPAGGLGVSPSYNIPRDWGIRGLIESISAESNKNR